MCHKKLSSAKKTNLSSIIVWRLICCCSLSADGGALCKRSPSRQTPAFGVVGVRDSSASVPDLLQDFFVLGVQAEVRVELAVRQVGSVPQDLLSLSVSEDPGSRQLGLVELLLERFDHDLLVQRDPVDHQLLVGLENPQISLQVYLNGRQQVYVNGFWPGRYRLVRKGVSF